MNEETIEKRVVKRGNKWCVTHGSDSPTPGKIIKCFPTHKAALKMHRAIMWTKYKDLFSNNELLEFTKSAMISQDDDLIINSFKEIARRKENKKLDWTLKTKELPETVYNVWKRIKIKLNNREVAIIVLKPTGYERLKSYLTFNYKIKELPNKLKNLILRIHSMSDERLLELRKRLDE